MGEEIDKIYVQLKQYETEIKQSNHKLDQMFDASHLGLFHRILRILNQHRIRLFIQRGNSFRLNTLAF